MNYNDGEADIEARNKTPTVSGKKSCANESCLWDSGRKDYKNSSSKIDTWKQVSVNLNIEGVDDVEVRLKWQSLPSHFKVHLSKFRAGKSSQGTGEIAKTSWPHLSEMMFLESSEVTQSFPSTSTLELEDEYDNWSILNELTQLSNTQPSIEAVQPTPVHFSSASLVSSVPLVSSHVIACHPGMSTG